MEICVSSAVSGVTWGAIGAARGAEKPGYYKVVGGAVEGTHPQPHGFCLRLVVFWDFSGCSICTDAPLSHFPYPGFYSQWLFWQAQEDKFGKAASVPLFWSRSITRSRP
jgi:hypothetical protein